jgi:hypothetical protein
MAGCRSAPEIEQQHLQAFGPELGPVYHALYNEVLWLHMKWLEYRKLYGGSSERVKLLNSTSPFFFYVVEEVIREDVLLHIARLTDPAEQGKERQQNLTLLRLTEKVADRELAEQIRGLVKTAKMLARFARTWRNKRLAHVDLDYSLNSRAFKLPLASVRRIEGALEGFRHVMNRLESAYLHSTTAYDHASAGAGDAEALVCWLAEARQIEDGRQQRAREGKSRPEDFQSPFVP